LERPYRQYKIIGTSPTSQNAFIILNTVCATVQDGRIELAEQVTLPEGARLLVTLLPDDEANFWLTASDESLAAVWDNTEDDAYAQLLNQ
jgi:hypothetical protein